MRSSAGQTCSYLLTSLLLGSLLSAAQQTEEYSKQLEGLLVSKITNERNDAKLIEEKQANKKEIGKETTKYIKEEVKEAYLQFLSTSDLSMWPELKERFDKVKQACEKFEQKYKSELGVQTTSSSSTSVVTPSLLSSPQMSTASGSVLAQQAPTPVEVTPTTSTVMAPIQDQNMPVPVVPMTTMVSEPVATIPVQSQDTLISAPLMEVSTPATPVTGPVQAPVGVQPMDMSAPVMGQVTTPVNTQTMGMNGPVSMQSDSSMGISQEAAPVEQVGNMPPALTVPGATMTPAPVTMAPMPMI